MNKYIKYTIYVVLFSVFISYFSFFRTKVTLDGGVEYQGEIVSSSISIEDGYIAISSFVEEIIDNKWVSENELIINGNHEVEGKSNYKFNTVDINLEKLDVDIDKVNIFDENYNILYKLSYNDAILSKVNKNFTELYLFKDEKLIQIGTLRNLEKEPFLISKNLNKVLYLDKDNEISTYNITNGKRKNAVLSFNDDTIVDFFNQFSISDDGGYFLYCLLSKNFSESSFSIYGADSGRLYAKDIIGVNPSWSILSDKVAFFYSGDVTTDVLSKSRVGVLSLKSKKITYYDRTNEGENYFGNMYWTKDNEKVVFTSSANNDKYINVLDIAKMVKLNYNVSDIELKNNIKVIGDKVYWTSDNKDGKRLSILETTGKSPVYIEKLRKIDAALDNYLMLSNDDVYVIQGSYLMLVSGEFLEQVAYIDDNSKLLSISPDGTYALIEKKDEGNIELKVYTIK